MPTYSPEQYGRRDRALLTLAGNYRVLLARSAAALSAGKPLTHALNRLTDGGDLVRHERILPGGLTLYTLSPPAAARLGLPRDRAELPNPAALDAAIAMQVFAHLGRHPRHRLTAEEAAALLQGAAPANVSFVVSDELGPTSVFRTLLAGNRSPAEAVRYVRTLVDQAERHGSLGRWIASRQLGFALLATSTQQVTALEKSVVRSRLLERAPVVVDLGPDAENLAAVLKAMKAK